MHSLFLKIFLWFWLAMALVAGALVVSVISTRGTAGPEKAREFADHVLSLYAANSARVLEEQGEESLDRYVSELERTAGLRIAVFDERIVPLNDTTFPAAARQLARRTLRTGQPQFGVTPRFIFASRSVTSASGKQYAVVGLVPRTVLSARLEPLDLAIRILAVVLTAGLVCYGLARYLTSPLGQLRDASRELAHGNLGSRVPEALGRRGDEFSELAEDFNTMAARIQGLVDSQRRLLGDISHELRSPLARLNVALELARKRAGPDALDYLERIQLEAERMNEMVGQLLYLARVENQMGSRMAPVDLAEIVRETVADAEFEASAQNRSVQLKSSQPVTVTGAPDLLRSAVENVIRNAMRYTAENTAVEVALVTEKQDSRSGALIRVRDHGPGVPDQSLDMIFRPFYRVGEARDRQSGGIGLGLAIAERAVRLHGGSIHASNAPDGGLVIEMRLPAK